MDEILRVFGLLHVAGVLTCLPEHDKTIHILNTHAGILSSDSKKGSRKFANAFAKFIKLFEISGFDESYLDGKDTEVTHAYYAFVNCAASEMKHTMRPKRHS